MYLHSTPKLIKNYYNKFIWDKSAEGRRNIFLTFDDGPIPELTEYVLDELAAVSARATFFCVGDNVRKYPEIFNRTVASGHSFGNHTYNHLNGLKTKTTDYVDNVKLCDRQITKTGFSRLRKLFRPPYGLIKSGQAKRLLPDYDVVMWDVLSGDFDQDLNPEKCLKKTVDNTKPGSIVVFHDNYKAERTLKYVLPRYLNHFSEKGFTFEAL